MVHGAQDDARCFSRGFHHVIRQCGAALFQRPEADLCHLPLETELVARICAVEHGERRFGNLGPDAVARQNENFHGEITKSLD